MTRRLMALAGRLYPRAWRERYSEEFEALMADLPSQSLSTVWDVFKGAVAMQAKFNGGRVGRTAMMAGLVGGLVAGVGSFAIPNVYVSSALIAGESMTHAASNQAAQRVLAEPRVQSTIEKYKLYPGISSAVAIETMRKNVRVYAPRVGKKGDGAFAVSFAYPDASVARDVVTDLTQGFIQDQRHWQVLDSASLPRNHSEPNRPIVAFAGLFAGAVLGGIWATCRAVFARADQRI